MIDDDFNLGPNVDQSPEAFRKYTLRRMLAWGDYLAANKPEFVPGETGIPVTTKVWDGMEMAYMAEAVMDGWWTEGRFTDIFEERFAEWIGTRFASFCNSGSSANFMALGACMSPLLGDRRLRVGDPVITVAAGFPTTINPILFWRLKPVFLDVELGTYVPKVGAIKRAIEEFCVDGRGAVMIAHTLGNPWRADLFKDYDGIFIIEDNCDALGSTVDGANFINKKTGTLGHLATHSFYPAHHMTTGEGGMVVGNNGRLKLAVESIRDWGRDCWCPPGEENTCGKRFDWKFDDLPDGYDHKYVYSHLGLNLKSTDIQAALGLAQLNRLDGFIEKRRQNFTHLRGLLNSHKLGEFFILPQDTPGTEPSWFGFPLTIRPQAETWDGLALAGPHFKRETLMRFLTERKIGTRLLFSSSYIRQPVFKDVLKNGFETKWSFDLAEPFQNTEQIVKNTFWIGCHPALTDSMIEYMVESLHEFVKTH
jgi:CDP-6-deoxy-D-xylo-4-hexulose-3-dehydrase